ncbi:MAG TPA: hypothetical protein VNH19_11490 [Candidatus Limnocylindrales bacterium]|nr:hypothetical protein [Candidatus Limnocylindrales bacterium]
METWNREQLYAEVWEQPLVKVAPKYGISAVGLGKVCGKLQIPLPGRGYWTKKEFGKPVERLPLPPGRDIPMVHRFTFPSSEKSPNSVVVPKETPTDPEFLRIVAIESRNTAIVPDGPRHKLVKVAEKAMKRVKPDDNGLLHPRYSEPCLEIHVSRSALERALGFMNAVILCLEAEGFPVTVQQGKHTTSAQIFGYEVPFAIVEKLRETGRREVMEYSRARTTIDYAPKGELEFRVGDYTCGRKFRDSKKGRLEEQLSTCLGGFLREGRNSLIAAKRAEQQRIEDQVKEREREELARQITDEEKKVKNLDIWVTNWTRAQQTRDFIAALEKVWAQEGHDLSPEAPKGQRIIWMKQQADRLDPILPSPPSILDRKGELNQW